MFLSSQKSFVSVPKVLDQSKTILDLQKRSDIRFSKKPNIKKMHKPRLYNFLILIQGIKEKHLKMALQPGKPLHLVQVKL